MNRTSRMSRMSRRIASTAVPALVALGALAGPARAADATATVTWYGGGDYATIQLNDEAVNSVINYSVGLGAPSVDNLCQQIDDTINSLRQARGYTVGLSQPQCVSFMRDCVGTSTNPRVQISVYADLTYRCGSYV
jgi:hypothetical protein